MINGKQLAQLELTTTSATNVLAPAKRTKYEITNIHLCNFTAGSVIVTLFHDNDSNSAVNGTIAYRSTIAGQSSEVVSFAESAGIYVVNPGTLLASANVANAVSVTAYGVEHAQAS